MRLLYAWDNLILTTAALVVLVLLAPAAWAAIVAAFTIGVASTVAAGLRGY